MSGTSDESTSEPKKKPGIWVVLENAFLTGSRVYGVPKNDSDIDLVVLVSAEDAVALTKMADRSDTTAEQEYEGGISLHFGKLNLICETNPEKVKKWRAGTDLLQKIKPVSRTTAKTVLQDYFDGLKPHGL